MVGRIIGGVVGSAIRTGVTYLVPAGDFGVSSTSSSAAVASARGVCSGFGVGYPISGVTVARVSVGRVIFIGVVVVSSAGSRARMIGGES